MTEPQLLCAAGKPHRARAPRHRSPRSPASFRGENYSLISATDPPTHAMISTSGKVPYHAAIDGGAAAINDVRIAPQGIHPAHPHPNAMYADKGASETEEPPSPSQQCECQLF